MVICRCCVVICSGVRMIAVMCGYMLCFIIPVHSCALFEHKQTILWLYVGNLGLGWFWNRDCAVGGNRTKIETSVLRGPKSILRPHCANRRCGWQSEWCSLKTLSYTLVKWLRCAEQCERWPSKRHGWAHVGKGLFTHPLLASLRPRFCANKLLSHDHT